MRKGCRLTRKIDARERSLHVPETARLPVVLYWSRHGSVDIPQTERHTVMDDASDHGFLRSVRRDEHACPHVNLNDDRCGNRFSLGRLDQAFDVCFGAYRSCPMYHRINGEQARMSPPLITITRYGSAMPLRPTGT
ncbi:MAG TPA: hypothetical protein PK400_05015 [Phycisphaerales bacterium]|nr:hypothetical protein [Phycisphaerales bacterium]HRQ76032.1 hypothetical protein [Phycisphaerales bacterium]